MNFAFFVLLSTAQASVLSDARTAVSEIENVYKNMEKKAKDAAKSGDKQKQQCIVSKVSYITPLIEVSRNSLSTIETEVENGNTTKAEIELRKIKVAKNQVEQAESESNNCKGSSSNSTNKSEKKSDKKSDDKGSQDGSADESSESTEDSDSSDSSEAPVEDGSVEFDIEVEYDSEGSNMNFEDTNTTTGSGSTNSNSSGSDNEVESSEESMIADMESTTSTAVPSTSTSGTSTATSTSSSGGDGFSDTNINNVAPQGSDESIVEPSDEPDPTTAE